jgi:hypothetical protein
MRTKAIRRGILLSLGLTATLGMAACTANELPGSVGPGTSHTAPPAASDTAPPAASDTAPPAPSRTRTHAATSAGVQNLVVTSAERSALTAAYAATYAAGLRIQVSGLGAPAAGPASVYYAYDPATDTYWALASFEPTASYSDPTAYMDGTTTGMFKKAGTAAWQVMIPINPDICEELRFFPQTVLITWALPTTPPAGLTC